MKTASFLAALNIAKMCLGGSENALPVLSHFCFDGGMLYAYDDTSAVIVEYETGLECALHGDTLLGLLEASKGSEELEIVLKEGRVHIGAGSGLISVPTLRKEDFIFQLPGDEPQFTLPLTDDTVAALERCLVSISNDTLNPEYTGVTFAADGGALTFYSTDNATASRYVPERKLAGRAKAFAAVLPESSCAKLLKLRAALGGKDDMKMHIGPRVAVTSFGGEPAVTLVSKVIPARLDQFGAVFDHHAKTAQFYPVPAQLLAEVRKASVLLARESVKVCVLDFAKGKLTIAVDGTMGKMRSVIATEVKTAGAVCIEPERLQRILPYVDQIAVHDERSLVMHGGVFTHIVCNRAGWKKDGKPPGAAGEIGDEDIPF